LHVDGTLRVLRSGGYSPALGDDFGIFSFARMTGPSIASYSRALPTIRSSLQRWAAEAW
jgi:hypothetical protein